MKILSDRDTAIVGRWRFVRKKIIVFISQYHRNKRESNYHKGKLITGLRWRKLVHPIMLFMLKINKVINRWHLIVNDNREWTGRPTIYACTHVGRYDVEVLVESIKEHVFIFVGDPNDMYVKPEGFILFLNGQICVDLDYKKDRIIAKERAIELLKKGGNLMIFPEGAWNITENQVVMPLFMGTIDMALASGADIVPIAVTYSKKNFHVNIGATIRNETIQKYERTEMNLRMRDTLCSLQWENWIKNGIWKRSDIPLNYSKTYIDEIMGEGNIEYTVDDINRTRYKYEIEREISAIKADLDRIGHAN